MITLDHDFLEAVGLGSLDGPTANRLLAHIYEQLKAAVGYDLASQMTDEQLTTFETLLDAEDEPRALAWLEQELPHYPEVVERQFEMLRAEIHRQASAILRFEAELAARCESSG
jgi:hypothetical protein